MSKNDLCDTAMEQEPIIEACTACTSQHEPQGDMQHIIRSHCQERESVTYISERHRNALPRKSHVLQNWASEKKRCANVCAFWFCTAFTLTTSKKVNMVTSPCRQDPFQKFLRNRDGTSVFDNCQQIWFEFLRTRVDEVRRTRTGNHTSPTLPWKWKTARVYIHWRILLVSLGPLPLTQSRQEHVHRVRRTHKGLVCIYVGGVCRHVGGFQPLKNATSGRT